MLTRMPSAAMIQTGFRNATIIGAVIKLTGASLIEEISHIPAVHEKGPVVLEKIILAGQMAYSDAYKYVYFVSIAFGVISIVAAAFLGDIDQFMVCAHHTSTRKTDTNLVVGRPCCCCDPLRTIFGFEVALTKPWLGRDWEGLL